MDFTYLIGIYIVIITDCHVSWLHKTDVLKHTQTAKHRKAKKRPLHSDIFLGEGTLMHSITVGGSKCAKFPQCSLGEAVSVSAKKNELITDLITIFAVADIPLQKVDGIRPFLCKC